MIDVETKKLLTSLLKKSCQTRLKMWSKTYDEMITGGEYLKGIRFSLYQIEGGERLESDAWQLCMPPQFAEHSDVDSEHSDVDYYGAQTKCFIDECVLNAIELYDLRARATLYSATS